MKFNRAFIVFCLSVILITSCTKSTTPDPDPLRAASSKADKTNTAENIITQVVGEVLEVNETPIQGASVTATNIGFSVSTDASGFYTILLSGPGTYILSYTKPGYSTVQEPVFLDGGGGTLVMPTVYLIKLQQGKSQHAPSSH